MKPYSITRVESIYGRTAQDRRREARAHSIEGARAALETFYYSFNNRSIDVFDDVWANDELISLNNPLGGIMRGIRNIRALYLQIYEGPAQVWVEFHDIVEYASGNTIVFAGRERGKFTRNGVTLDIKIRTTRIFAYLGADVGWRQVHHHGSIDDADELKTYQNAVRGN